MKNILCEAILFRRLVSLVYKGKQRTVEPHMVAQNEAGYDCLVAWFVRGHYEGDDYGWREYLLSEMSDAQMLDETFPAPRPGYNRKGNSKFRRIYCHL